MDIGIIGGGVMGLVLGYRLGQSGHKVTIFESAAQVGGLSTWYDFGPFVWDKYYHVILRSDSTLLSLIEELGLSNQLHWEETKTGFMWQGELLSMSNHWEFLTFPALNLWEKGRLGVGIIYNQMVKDPTSLKNKTAAVWLRHLFGQQVYSKVWEPLLESKFGVLKEKVPAIILWSTLQRYYSTRSKGDGKEWMGHLRGGCLKVLLESLKKKIEKNGGVILCKSPITEVTPLPDGKINLSTSETSATFSHVISTLPRNLLSPNQGNLPLPTFLGVIRLALVLKKPLTPFYVTNLIDRHFPFTGIIDVTNLGKNEEFANHGLVMLPRYDTPDSEWFTRSDEEITHSFLNPLLATWPHLREMIVNTVIHREKRVQALWIDSSPPPETPMKQPGANLWNVHNELIGYSNLNNNAVIEVANRVSQVLIGEVK